MYTMKAEYTGYHDQRLKSVSFEPVWNLELITSLLAVPLVFAFGAELSRLARRKFTAAPSPSA